jgi:hypothetical protein
MRLTIELVPRTCWYSNVRSEVPAWKWEALKRKTFRAAGYKCEICGGTGDQWPVECHEIWEYNDTDFTQTLGGLLALCPNCHQVKHIGKAGIDGNYDEAVAHLMSVNDIDEFAARMYADDAFMKWSWRSGHEWTLDISWLGKKQEKRNE